MNWTIREDRSQLFSFLGGFFADGDEVDIGLGPKAKNSVRKLATRGKKTVTAHDCK